MAIALGLIGSCNSPTVPDFNQPGLDEFLKSPTRASVIAAATGLLIGAGDNIAEAVGYVILTGIVGREAYFLDAVEPRFVTELLIGPLSPGGPFGGNLWNARYGNIRNANNLLTALDRLPESEMTNEERRSIQGFARTIKALDVLLVINTRDTNGAPIDVDRPLGAPPAPIESKDAVLEHVARLLDEGMADLIAGGSEFPFPLGAGFTGFDTPSTFLKFNRGLKARVEVYRGNYVAALAALDESFESSGAALDLGVYYEYGTGSGEQSNLLNHPAILAHPSILADADRKPDGSLDDRVMKKTAPTSPRTLLDITSDLDFSLYPELGSPVPILRNEELILLRAEAAIGLGDLATALVNINAIRVRSGGLAPLETLDPTGALDELLHQKRYSLLFEGGHRWIDLRRYGRLAELPLDQPHHVVHDRFPIPLDELLPRD